MWEQQQKQPVNKTKLQCVSGDLPCEKTSSGPNSRALLAIWGGQWRELRGKTESKRGGWNQELAPHL